MAKKFSFRLEPLLRIRTHKVNSAKESLGGVMRIRYKKDEAISERNDYKAEMLARPYSSGKVQDMQARLSHKQLVESELNNLDKERRQLLEIESLRRKKLQDAMKDEKILLKLKGKKITIHKKETDDEEMKFIDEIAISRYIPPNFDSEDAI